MLKDNCLKTIKIIIGGIKHKSDQKQKHIQHWMCDNKQYMFIFRLINDHKVYVK